MTLTRAQAVYVAARRALDAWFVRFDPAGTGLASTNVQDAIVEVAAGAGGGGGSAWGGITGTLSDQADLQTALDAKDAAGAAASAVAAHVALADPHAQYAMDSDLAGYVPTTRTINSKPLSANVTLTASDVGAGTGTVTTVSVATANGFAGTVANPGSTPAITLTTSITGLLKGNGTAVSAAAAGTDYVAPATTVNGHALSANVTVTASDVGLGSVTNDAQTKASVVPNTAPSAGQLLAGNAGGTAYAPVSVSGDATLASTGALTLTSRRQLANVTLGSAGASLSSGTIAACKFLEVHIFVPSMAGSDTPSLQFNASGGTAYRYKWTHQAAAATAWTAGNTAVSTDRIKIASSDSARGRRVVAAIGNDSAAIEKNVAFSSSTGTNSAATQAQVDHGNGAWITGAATQITQIDLISTSNMNAGTQMTVFGWN